MNTANLRIAYRPVRIGWCVRSGNFDDIRRVLLWTHTLWGGRYNPVIPVGAGAAEKQIVEHFHVDVLYPASEVPLLLDFVDSFAHLKWPGFMRRSQEFFEETGFGKAAPCLDVTHPISWLHRDFVKGEQIPKINCSLFQWDADDPLSLVFLCQFGDYPPEKEVGGSYGGYAVQMLNGQRVSLRTTDIVPQDSFKALTPSAIASFDLEPTFPSERQAGFYVGRAENFEDIVNFWNLRAANREVIFFDDNHGARLDALKNSYSDSLTKLTIAPDSYFRPIGVWSNEKQSISSINFGPAVAGNVIHRMLPTVLAPGMHHKARSVLANLTSDQSRNKVIVSTQLPDKPFQETEVTFHQNVVIGISASLVPDSQNTLATPYVPEMNQFYRHSMILAGDDVRVQPEGFGIVTTADVRDLSFYALKPLEVIAEFFRTFGIQAQRSEAGRIANRIIQQMGGLQGCRVFKLPGVRTLIEKYGPLNSFTRGSATAVIAQPHQAGKILNFPRIYVQAKPLTPSSTFDYLLEKMVFRAGLEPVCPNCNLDFWLALEPLAHEVTCEYCGERFKLTAQLKDRDWRFRRSGLFGKNNHQEGSIPVAVTLQQLDANVRSVVGGFMLLETSMNLSSAGAKISPCETDLVILRQDLQGRIELAIGECKSRGRDSRVLAEGTEDNSQITDDDIKKLASVAEVFDPDRVTVYFIFAKTGPFSAAELRRLADLENRHRQKVILLSERELEPYYVYEKTAKEFQVKRFATSVGDLARATPNIFFRPKTASRTTTDPESPGNLPSGAS